MHSIHIFGILIASSAIVSLLISMRATHHKALGFTALCSIGVPFVIGNYFGQEYLRGSQTAQLIILILFAVHTGSLFVWFYLHAQIKKSQNQ